MVRSARKIRASVRHQETNVLNAETKKERSEAVLSKGQSILKNQNSGSGRTDYQRNYEYWDRLSKKSLSPEAKEFVRKAKKKALDKLNAENKANSATTARGTTRNTVAGATRRASGKG